MAKVKQKLQLNFNFNMENHDKALKRISDIIQHNIQKISQKNIVSINLAYTHAHYNNNRFHFNLIKRACKRHYLSLIDKKTLLYVMEFHDIYHKQSVERMLRDVVIDSFLSKDNTYEWSNRQA